MKIVDEFPHRIFEKDGWIPMPDGVRLSARIWLPESADRKSVPAILEYIPYRKSDATVQRDTTMHPYFAGHGYAAVRVDLRGSGDSEGVLTDEYLEQELADGEAVIRWLSEQPWCNGNVGMYGISWGGFNGLMIAARRPPALKAIITACSTDDRYSDDVHYMGGCLLGDNLSWASTMFAFNSLPPDPRVVGDRWRDMWKVRLEQSGLWLENWLEHQHRDDYWKHGSVCEDFSAIECPVFAVSGWADGYSNAVFRMMRNLRVPRLGLIGPWSHKYPHIGVPGPAIGFLQEALRWWDRWLKGVESGITAEPMLRVWMQDSVRPSTGYDHRPGRWISERSWPSPRIESHRYCLVPARLVPGRDHHEETPVAISSPISLGLFGGKWCSFAAPPDLPDDQREEDGGALVFDTDPLDAPLEILGAPEVELELSSDRPVAMIAVRLSDLHPDGKATRVTYGLLNLTHRESHEAPAPLDPGKRYRVRVRMNEVAQRFPQGHRLRVALSTSYWPLAWPSPEPTMLTIYAGRSHFDLPVRSVGPADEERIQFGEAEGSRTAAQTVLSAPDASWRVIRNLGEGSSTLEVVNDHGVCHLHDNDLTVHARVEERYYVDHDDLSTIRGETLWTRSLARRPWRVDTRTKTVLTSTPTEFRIIAELDAHDADSRVASLNWDVRILRRLV